jgi:two-component system LytT family sensor kinase
MNFFYLLKEPWPRIIGIPIIAFIMLAVIDGFEQNVIEEYLINLLFIAVMWNGDYYIILKFRKIYPRLSDTFKRVLSTVLAVCLYNLLADFVLCSILGYFNVEGFENYFDDGFKTNISQNLITTAIIGAFYEAGYFFDRWKKQTIEIEQVKSQQLRSELSVLKNQISPHFLFNSLNTLVTLIHENPNHAAKFTEKLSQVYRHILQHKDKEIIQLKTELESIKAYYYLLNMRFESSLTVSISIDDATIEEKYGAPLTIQMLIENAVKHNVVSVSKPLLVEIYTENGKSLIVRNNLQLKTMGVESLKTGLENIIQRYKHLSDREVDIIETREHYMVALPLIEMAYEPKYAAS